MKKQFSFLLALALANGTSVQALTHTHNSNVFKETLDDFILRMTPEMKEQEGFRAYYSNFLDRQSRLSLLRRKKRLRRLRMDGLSSLEIKNKKHYKVLAENKQADIDNQSRDTRLFLVRYRLFEDYQQHKYTRRVYFLNKAKMVLTGVSTKVSSFLSSVKHRVIT